MDGARESVRSYVSTLVPATLLDDISCFFITANIPGWVTKPDLIVATKRGEIVKIANRQPVACCRIDDAQQPEEIRLHYNNNLSDGAPNYVVRTPTRVFVVDDQMRTVAKFDDVSSYELSDPNTCGRAKISLWFHDDAMPKVLDDEYRIDDEQMFRSTRKHDDDEDGEQLMAAWMSNLSKARLNTASNAAVLEQRRRHRQDASHVLAEDSRYDLDSVEKNTKCEIFDKINVGKIWQRVHNSKWIIGIPVENISESSIEDIEILLKCGDKNIFQYVTSFFIKNERAPLFNERISLRSLSSKESITIILNSDVPSFNCSSIVTLKCSLKYIFNDAMFYIPISDIVINVMDIINGCLDPVLCKIEDFEACNILAMYSTSVVTDIDIQFISTNQNSFSTYLKENLGYCELTEEFPNIFRHIKSPLHILHGSLIQITHEDENTTKVTIVTRSEEQLLLLVNVFYDLLPSRIVVLPVEQNSDTIKTFESQSTDCTFISEANQEEENEVNQFGAALYEEMSLVSEYLNRCITHMSESRLVSTSSKSDDCMNINLTSMGRDEYEKFKCDLKKLTEKRNRFLKKIL